MNGSLGDQVIIGIVDIIRRSSGLPTCNGNWRSGSYRDFQVGFFYKKNLGDQFIRVADSIALNIAEGYGRFHFKENRQFCWYARGSLFETKTANHKALNRNLITSEDFTNILTRLERCNKLLNAYIRSIGKTNTNNDPNDLVTQCLNHLFP